MNPATVVAWLQDPKAIKSDALMPRLEIPEAEARDLMTFLFETPLPAPSAPVAPEPAPLLDRRVTYEEVETRVFKKVCWHCHSDPEPVGGDGGPGNTGGFGFAGKGLDFGSHAAVVRGGGLPRVVAVLRARHVEVAGGEVPGVRGMPLGLTPIALDDIRLVETWIAQGARGPGD
jgi:hypothetical protein